MRRFRRQERRHGGQATAVADPPADPGTHAPATTEEIHAEVERLTQLNRARPDRATERRLLWLRHVAGARAIDSPPATLPEYARAELDRLPLGDPLPEFPAADVTPGLLRAGILRDGCLLVRGFVARYAALGFAERIDQLFAERERHASGQPVDDGLYEEFKPQPRFDDVVARPWIKDGGGVLAADSPRLSFELLELFGAAGIGRLVTGYLGETPLISVHKTTLRKADPSVAGAWHQDGSFMGEVRSLNLWLSLSRCGDSAPGLDLVPRRLEQIVLTQTDEAVLPIQVSRRNVEQAAGDTPIVRPIFEPGDALFFDELFLHQTASDPAMPNPRFAVESWFFGSSCFPADYAPVAVT